MTICFCRSQTNLILVFYFCKFVVLARTLKGVKNHVENIFTAVLKTVKVPHLRMER